MFLASDSSEESNRSTRQQTIARKGKQKPRHRQSVKNRTQAPRHQSLSFLPKEEEKEGRKITPPRNSWAAWWTDAPPTTTNLAEHLLLRLEILRRRNPVDTILQQFHRQTRHRLKTGSNRRQRRRQILRIVGIIETDHRNIFGNAQIVHLDRMHHTGGEHVVQRDDASGTTPESSSAFITRTPSLRCHMPDSTTKRSSNSTPASSNASR
mgnify:CR=1 FL=1